MTLTMSNFFKALGDAIEAFIMRLYGTKAEISAVEANLPPQTPNPAPVATIVPELSFDTPKQAWHATRVLCDQAGLPTTKTILVNGELFAPKDIICACVYQESAFLTNPRPNQNKDPKTGLIWSTDYGIVQVNDRYQIGRGKRYPSVGYVLANPGKCVQWMIDTYKATNALQPWSSYTSGVYKKWLLANSRMWDLAA